MSHYDTNTSLASTSTTHIIIDYEIGDRVIIKSSQGLILGTVRYIGYTEFAPGEWVGVELDDPRGKNDGSVDGKRYFACQPNFGLFAPISKVSKSPSQVERGACAIQKSGLPPTGMRRANSKESMTSATSSVRRDMVKDKVQTEQLLEERDLEWQEFTKAASQVKDAVQELHLSKNECLAYRAEFEVKLQGHMALLTELKNDRSELLGQLENEKKENEDLRFKFQEAAIIKSDVEMELALAKNQLEELNNIRNGLSQQLTAANLEHLKTKQEFQQLKLKLDATIKESSKQKQEHQEKLQHVERELQEKQLKYEEKEGEISNIRKELEDRKNGFEEAESKNKQKINELMEAIEKIKEESSVKLSEIETKLMEKNDLIEQKDEKIKEIEVKLQEQIEKSQCYVDEIIKSYSEKIDNITNEKDKIIENIRTSMEEKLKSTDETKHKYEEKLKSLSQNEDELKASLLKLKLNAESQVKCLNSIIVDMRKKNEEAAGFSPAAAEELNLLGYSTGSRQLTPRMYCNICERFDAHESVVCPQEMSEDMPPSRKRKRKSPPSPNSELCEMLVHYTQDCELY